MVDIAEIVGGYLLFGIPSGIFSAKKHYYWELLEFKSAKRFSVGLDGLVTGLLWPVVLFAKIGKKPAKMLGRGVVKGTTTILPEGKYEKKVNQIRREVYIKQLELENDIGHDEAEHMQIPEHTAKAVDPFAKPLKGEIVDLRIQGIR